MAAESADPSDGAEGPLQGEPAPAATLAPVTFDHGDAAPDGQPSGDTAAAASEPRRRNVSALLLSLVPWLLTAAVLLWALGLSDRFSGIVAAAKWTIWPPTAMIFVESPEVYTRERLINERSAEESWLNDQLREVDRKTGIANTYVSMASSFNVEAAPGPGGSPAAPPRPVSGGDRTPGEAESAALPLSFDQSFKLMSAYRSNVREHIIENRLDDRHDLQGNALYILKFDNTVIGVPAGNERAYVEVRISPPAAISNLSKTSFKDRLETLESQDGYAVAAKNFDAWRGTLEARINANIARRLSRVRTGGFSPIEDKELIEYLSDLFPQFGRTVIVASVKHFSSDVGDHLPDEPTVQNGAVQFLVRKSLGEVTGDNPEEIKLERIETHSTNPEKWNVLAPAFSEYVTMLLTNGPGASSTPRIEVSPYVASFAIINGDCPFGGSTLPALATNKFLEEQNAGLQMSMSDKGELVERSWSLFHAGEWASKQLYQIQDWAEVRKQLEKAVLVPQVEKDRLLQGVRGCPTSIGVTVESGLINFVGQIGGFYTYSYSVLPRESSVAVFSEVVNTAQALASVRGVSAARESSSRTRGWNLKPVLTTFGDTFDVSGDNPQPVVGWIIDPSAQSSTLQSPYEPATSTESVLAIISVPAWWSEVSLQTRRGWLRTGDRIAGLMRKLRPRTKGDGAASPDAGENGSETSDLRLVDENTTTYNVKLPNRPEFLDTLLLDRVSRQPLISDVDTVEGVRNSVKCNEVAVLISGPRLWRNTSVTLGGLKADRIEVMPNMEGIIATFKGSEQGTPWTATGRLRVWTSEGVAQYPEKVTLNADAGSCAPVAAP